MNKLDEVDMIQTRQHQWEVWIWTVGISSCDGCKKRYGDVDIVIPGVSVMYWGHCKQCHAIGVPHPGSNCGYWTSEPCISTVSEKK